MCDEVVGAFLPCGLFSVEETEDLKKDGCFGIDEPGFDNEPCKLCPVTNYGKDLYPERDQLIQYGTSKPAKTDDEAFLNWVKDNLEVKK